MKYRIKRIKGGYQASLHVPFGEHGEIVFSASAYMRDVERALRRKHGDELGFSLKGIFRDVKKLTRSKALRGAVRTATTVTKSPAFKLALTAAAPLTGGATLASLKGLESAEKLLTNATRAPRGSRKRIAARTAIKLASIQVKKKASPAARPPKKRPARRRARPTAARQASNSAAAKYLVQVVPS